MPSLPFHLGKIKPSHATDALRFWKSVRDLATGEIEREAALPFVLALSGTPDATAALSARLSQESPANGPEAAHRADIAPYVTQVTDAANAAPGSLLLPAADTDEASLAVALARLATDNPGLRLSLAKHIPAFRPIVAAQLIAEASWDNARIALISALPGVIPLGDIFLPATALGDMILLTRNQAMLLLRIAAAYGHAPDIQQRTRELLPVVGSAFGWRAVARELIGLVPGGIGLVVKGSVAYAGTYTVGKAAAIYYSTGQTLSGPRLKQLYRDALRDATGRVKTFLRRPQNGNGNITVNNLVPRIDKSNAREV